MANYETLYPDGGHQSFAARIFVGVKTQLDALKDTLSGQLAAAQKAAADATASASAAASSESGAADSETAAGNSALAARGYADAIAAYMQISGAAADDLLQVDTVDANGVPTAWKLISFADAVAEITALLPNGMEVAW